tara:strand:- start:41 stop:163 length:123 start_codon:yes stop_codon:yes gene_type:complete
MLEKYFGIADQEGSGGREQGARGRGYGRVQRSGESAEMDG